VSEIEFVSTKFLCDFWEAFFELGCGFAGCFGCYVEEDWILEGFLVDCASDYVSRCEFFFAGVFLHEAFVFVVY